MTYLDLHPQFTAEQAIKSVPDELRGEAAHRIVSSLKSSSWVLRITLGPHRKLHLGTPQSP